MKKSKVITIPNPKLKEKSLKVSSFDSALNSQIKEMLEVLRSQEGVGLAANQIGYPNQVILIEFQDPDKKESIPLQIFINPEVVEFGKELEDIDEGCLSVPKIEFAISRPGTLKVKYLDEKGHYKKSAPKGLLARILQHEIDHLNGILFIERAKKQFLEKFPFFKDLKILFLGSGDFAAIILEGLMHLGLNLEIYTEPPKPAGRGHKLRPTPVACVAEKFGEKYIELASFAEDVGEPKDRYDFIISADFGQKIPDAVLNRAKFAAINLHPSLLPKHRGPSPIQTAILEGEKITGASIIKMTDKIDAGPIFSAVEIEINPNENYIKLRDRLATTGLKLLVKTLPLLALDKIQPKPQDESKATFTKKIQKKDGLIDWKKSSKQIERQIRALHPWPKAYTVLDNKRLIIHQAHLENKKLVLDIVQFEGKNPVRFSEFQKGFRGPKPEWF